MGNETKSTEVIRVVSWVVEVQNSENTVVWTRRGVKQTFAQGYGEEIKTPPMNRWRLHVKPQWLASYRCWVDTRHVVTGEALRVRWKYPVRFYGRLPIAAEVFGILCTRGRSLCSWRNERAQLHLSIHARTLLPCAWDGPATVCSVWMHEVWITLLPAIRKEAE